jgi:guanosine-3',5'-bis(diphosphate) 3'-pyrophosphohydrolase
MTDVGLLLESMKFAAERHRDQRRKGGDASPYINHLIEVAHLLANVGGETDIGVLVAAVLHDTVEDTKTRPEEIEKRFGPRVRRLVEEVTDDKTLDKPERKRLQVEHAPSLSPDAKKIKIADKTSNIRDVTENPPHGWSLTRRQEYLDWAERVVAGCRGSSPPLEAHFDRLLQDCRLKLHCT